VEVDGTAVATVGVEAVAGMRLAVGRRLDERGLAALLEEGAVVAACDRALNILGFRDRSAVELRRSLIKKGVEAGPATAAVDRLRDAGLVDDARYARAVARSKALNAGASRRRIEQELARRGVPREVADEAIAEVWVEEAVDQVAAATALARKRAPSLARLDPASRRRRMYGFLARRGYSGEEIRLALAAVDEESDEPMDDPEDGAGEADESEE
jgi:regulatory protein